MLEEIKEVLINEKQQELNYRKQIDNEISTLSKLRDKKQKETFETLSKLESDIKKMNSNVLRRILYGKKIKELCANYASMSNLTREEIKLMNEKIESLYQKLNDLSYNEAIIEKKIQRVRQATSLQELGLTERAALKYIKNDEKKVIRAVFKNIKDTQSLETKTDIDKNLSELYQTNISPFVVAMQKINFDDLIQQLADIGIMIEEDKLSFLKKLVHQDKLSTEISLPINNDQYKTSDLDNIFYKQVQEDLINMKRYTAYPPIAISKIITLAVLISMAKINKKQIQNQE